MPVLLALFVLAFVALLWASISIAGVVRRARRRRHRHTVGAAKPDTDTSEVSPSPPLRLHSFPTRLGKHTVSSLGSEDLWERWSPFGTDFADLTDPTPSRRSRPTRSARLKDDR